MPDAGMHRLHICCAMRANGSFASRGNAEFFGCGTVILKTSGDAGNAGETR